MIATSNIHRNSIGTAANMVANGEATINLWIGYTDFYVQGRAQEYHVQFFPFYGKFHLHCNCPAGIRDASCYHVARVWTFLQTAFANPDHTVLLNNAIQQFQRKEAKRAARSAA